MKKQEERVVSAATSRALAIVERGLQNSQDYLNYLAALTRELHMETTRPQVGNAVCNAIGKTLKLVELQEKYGKDSSDSRQGKVLQIAE
jgi:hypothetical protein